MSEAYIVGAVRSPIGRRKGGLSGVHPVDLAAQVLSELMTRTGADPSAVEDVIMGCVWRRRTLLRNISPFMADRTAGC